MRTEEPAGRRIEHAETIDAPAEHVWSILSDLESWSSWNPLNTAANGTLAVGQTLDLIVVLPGMKPQSARPKIVSVEPNRGFEYQTTQAGGLMRAHRYFLIERLGAKKCIVRNGEIFSGLMGRLVAVLMGKTIRRGMQEMNLALKQRAETT